MRKQAAEWLATRTTQSTTLTLAMCDNVYGKPISRSLIMLIIINRAHLNHDNSSPAFSATHRCTQFCEVEPCVFRQESGVVQFCSLMLKPWQNKKKQTRKPSTFLSTAASQRKLLSDSPFSWSTCRSCLRTYSSSVYTTNNCRPTMQQISAFH